VISSFSACAFLPSGIERLCAFGEAVWKKIEGYDPNIKLCNFVKSSTSVLPVTN